MEILIYIFCLHFLADFVLQSREMGQKKSNELKWLEYHLCIQVLVLGIGLSFVAPSVAPQFAIINAVAHGFIDWNIWKLYKYSVYYRNKDADVALLKANWKYWDDSLFYTTIGLDQLLHGIILIALWSWFV